jgi:hypothetical protein
MDALKPRITSIDRMFGDAVISFQDNRTGLFPAAFLYAALPQVQELFEPEPELIDEADEDNSSVGQRTVS